MPIRKFAGNSTMPMRFGQDKKQDEASSICLVQRHTRPAVPTRSPVMRPARVTTCHLAVPNSGISEKTRSFSAILPGLCGDSALVLGPYQPILCDQPNKATGKNMLKDRLSPADVAAREKEMREALAACPRILDLVARGPLADPDAEAVVYLRSPLDPNPVIVSQRSADGLHQGRREFLSRTGRRQERSGRDLAADLPRGHRRDLGRGRLRHRRTGQSAVHARGHHRPAERGEGKIVAGAAARDARRPLREDRGIAERRAVAAAHRRRAARRDHEVRWRGAEPDPAWRDDYGKCRTPPKPNASP